MRILDKRARQEIIKEMTLCSIEENVIVFKQGLSGSYFYIIKEGLLEYHENEVFVKEFKRGESIGEAALIHSAPRSGTLKSKTKS